MGKSGLTPEVEEVRRECYRLLAVIAKRPGAAKLLTGVRDDLRIYAGYKQRDIRQRRKRPED